MSSTLLDKLYANLNDNNNVDYYFYIIQIKDTNPSLINYNQSLYIDIKNFISNYIKSVDKRDFGYDRINVEKIKSSICKVSSFQEKYSLFIYAYKALKENEFEIESEKIIACIRKTKLLALKESNSKLKYIKLVAHLISYNILAVLIVLILLFVISYIIFLPAHNGSLVFIEFHCEKFHSNFYINHLLNTICYLFDLSDDVKISPINWGGVFLLTGMKLFYIVCIVNYLFQVILERIKLK